MAMQRLKEETKKKMALSSSQTTDINLPLLPRCLVQAFECFSFQINWSKYAMICISNTVTLESASKMLELI